MTRSNCIFHHFWGRFCSSHVFKGMFDGYGFGFRVCFKAWGTWSANEELHKYIMRSVCACVFVWMGCWGTVAANKHGTPSITHSWVSVWLVTGVYMWLLCVTTGWHLCNKPEGVCVCRATWKQGQTCKKTPLAETVETQTCLMRIQVFVY